MEVKVHLTAKQLKIGFKFVVFFWVFFFIVLFSYRGEYVSHTVWDLGGDSIMVPIAGMKYLAHVDHMVQIRAPVQQPAPTRVHDTWTTIFQTYQNILKV